MKSTAENLAVFYQDYSSCMGNKEVLGGVKWVDNRMVSDKVVKCADMVFPLHPNGVWGETCCAIASETVSVGSKI